MKAADYELSLNKLIILFMLNNIKLPMTNTQLSDFILSKEYTNYFSLQQSLSELTDTDLVRTEEVQNSTRYFITDSGKKTLFYFENRVPDSIKEEIIEFLKKNKYKLRNEVEITAEYIPEINGEYTIHCLAKENDTVLIELKFNVISKEQALEMCANWKKNSHDIYSKILSELMK
jgi:predicted transcriptional regulator